MDEEKNHKSPESSDMQQSDTDITAAVATAAAAADSNNPEQSNRSSDEDDNEEELDNELDDDDDQKANTNGGVSTRLSLANFLFGNVDENGDLENDFLDEDTRRQIRSLDQLNIASGLIQEIKDDVKESASQSERQQAGGKSNHLSSTQASNASSTSSSSETAAPESASTSDEDYNKKLDSAVDYSDIAELADEIPEEDAKFRAALSELVFKMPTAPIEKPKKMSNSDDDDYDALPKSNEKMDELKNTSLSTESPKPASNISSATTEMIPTTTATATIDKGAPAITSKDSNASSVPTKADTLLSESEIGNDQNSSSTEAALSKKRLDTPLAAMLPSKYENCDVTKLFPEFRPNKTLRFARLFGTGKASHQPNLWKNVRNRKRRRRKLEEMEAASSSGKQLEKTEGTVSKTDSQFKLQFPPLLDDHVLASDDEDRLKRPVATNEQDKVDEDMNADPNQLKIADWRYGPARLWYDMINVPENGKNFDYGFKLKSKSIESEDEGEPSSPSASIDPDDCYHMVTQIQWENDIIWSGDEVKQMILSKLSGKYHAAGWVPFGESRTVAQFVKDVLGAPIQNFGQKAMQPMNSVTLGKKADKKTGDGNQSQEPDKDEPFYSLFPVDNDELVYHTWEDEIIWDVDYVDKIPEPKILTLDPNDENIVLDIPDDIDPNSIKPKQAVPIPLKEKKEHHLRKSRILLGKAGVIAEPEPESPPPPEEVNKDPFNISNDEFYNPKLSTETALKPTVGGNLIQHSIPALELRQIFFPTYIGQMKLRCFHRPPLKRYSHGQIADCLDHGVNPLVKHMKKRDKQRQAERQAAGGGDIFFMRTPEDLSAKDGQLILCEYSEEHPPLMMQIGMATKIKNYYKRRPGKDVNDQQYEYGETSYAHTSPFLGNLLPGQSLQALENNLFRAPIYKHTVPETDFLIIRTRNNYFIRSVDTIFTVGQELPLFEVPGPNSKKANNFIRDFLQVFIYRLFWSSTDTPRRIRMEDIKKAFPSHSESSIRKRLKLCADFKRTGLDSNWWVLKPEFRLPTEEEMRAMVSPEQCCAYYSMIAAELRLKDAGYGEKTLFTADDENDEDQQLKIDDEVKTAPWNTTRAFISAMKGKCLLQLSGVADPTGCGEGFSYVRMPNKPQISKEEYIKQQEPKKTVTGTDADLRRLPLQDAKNLLRKFNVPEKEIAKLTRWEVIDVVRTLSTAQVKSGAETMSKFARGNRFSIAEHQERYKEDAQRVFELQNRVLASVEELSTDEAETEEEDMDIEEMGKNIEKIIANKKTSQQLSLEREEVERLELQKLIHKTSAQNDKGKKTGKNSKEPPSKTLEEKDDDPLNLASTAGKLLKIYRTFKSADGKEFVRIETVRKPAVIAAYVKIRKTRDPEYIRKFATELDDQQKEEMRREKRRLQEQLRRLRRSSEKGTERKALKNRDAGLSAMDDLANDGFFDNPAISSRPLSELQPEKKKREKKEKEKKESKVKCSACGLTGHMRSNRVCPYYGSDPVRVAMTAEEEQVEKTTLEGEDLIKIDDTKLILSRTLINHEDELRKRSLILKVPRDVMKRRRKAEEHCDYLEKPEYKNANRCRTDPLVSLSIIFEQIINDLKQMNGTEVFWVPVNTKKVADYSKIISRPMDLQTMRKKIREKAYRSQEEFMVDVRQMYDNSCLYNGINHMWTATAAKMVKLAESRLQDPFITDKVTKLERAIDPLKDSDQVAFSYILECVVLQDLKVIPDSFPFHQPVSKTKYKNYYDIIKQPMDLERIMEKIKAHQYQSTQQFLDDLNLIYQNSSTFNGSAHQFTEKALEIVQVGEIAVKKNEQRLRDLERSIAETKAAILEGSGEENESDYYDENSQPGLTITQPNERQLQQDGIQLQQMLMEEEEGNDQEDIIYDNYDPSEFLFEKFNRPVAASEDEDSRQSAQMMMRPSTSAATFSAINERMDESNNTAVSDSDDEEKMEIDGEDQEDQADEDDNGDVWF